MHTTHHILQGDARSLESVPADSVELVVTSPPYPMIEMWDEQFGVLDPAIADALAEDAGIEAFERMHGVLGAVWDEVARTLVDGGIACINIGDATRKVDDRFRVYQNHARVIEAFERRGFEPLPDILWRKPTNSAAKFMGSGMLPPNAYVTLEHEYILIFRKSGVSRQFEPKSERRYESAYFWEERNRWFSDVWTDLRGIMQSLDHASLRDRSAAFPFELPYRLISMYSVYDDTVLDPFWGTGTTSIAAMAAMRDSIGVELHPEFRTVFEDRLEGSSQLVDRVIERRVNNHLEFVDSRLEAGEELEYVSQQYGFPVRTQQERSIQFYTIDRVLPDEVPLRVSHAPVEAADLGLSAADPSATE